VAKRQRCFDPADECFRTRHARSEVRVDMDKGPSIWPYGVVDGPRARGSTRADPTKGLETPEALVSRFPNRSRSDTDCLPACRVRLLRRGYRGSSSCRSSRHRNVRHPRLLRCWWAWYTPWARAVRESVFSRDDEQSNNTMNPTAGGAFLLPHGNCGAGARVQEYGPPAAGYGER
jgi:hypothetical protein